MPKAPGRHPYEPPAEASLWDSTMFWDLIRRS
jgi:hypothetical protein